MLVGEMCHFLDLMRYVTGESVVRVYAQALRLGTKSHADFDNLSVVVAFGDGTGGTLCYSTIGDRASSKARLEIDGGINRNTIARAVAAGVDTLVAGSAIFGKVDPVEAISSLRALAEASSASKEQTP